MDQPESPIRHGMENILLGPMHVQSGVEYVRSYEYAPKLVGVAPIMPPFALPPSYNPPDYSDTMRDILVRLDNIELLISNLSTYIRTPWYKRLYIWTKNLLGLSE
jgi:hypothetical protein